MNFEQLFKELKEETVAMAKDRFGNQADNVVSDMKNYFDHSRDKLEKWTELFAERKIDKDELTWLVKSQKDLLTLKTLHTAGVNKIALGHFKNKIMTTVLQKLILIAL